MQWSDIQSFLEFWMIAGILWLDWLIWRDGRKSLQMYSLYFTERTAWYKARGKAKREATTAVDVAARNNFDHLDGPAATAYLGPAEGVADPSAAGALAVPAQRDADN